MAVVEIPYQPGLTADDATEMFGRHFAGRYEVKRYTLQMGRSFLVRKSPFVGVTVGLRQRNGTTAFVFTGAVPFPGMLLFLPLALLGMLPGLIIWLVLRSSWKPIEEEVRWFLQDSGQFPLPAPNVWQGTPGYSPSGSLPCASCGAPAALPEPERQPLCTACRAPLGEDSRFCQKCGAPVPLPEPKPLPSASPSLQEGTYCTRCGTLAPQSSLFCHKCGAEVAPAQRNGAKTSAAGSKPAPKAPLKRGYCDLCGQELGVNEKMRGLTAHDRCPTPAAEAPASAPTTDAVETGATASTAPAAPDAAVGSPSTRRGYCDVCGQELGVNEKLMGLTVHRSCPPPVAEAPAAALAQASQVHCKECETPMPASSLFCHKCGSAVVVAAE